MKKDLKSKSKRKWIVGGVLLFGGVALLTTGFATWAIGVNQTKQNLGTNVTVEGTVNESVKLTITPVDMGINVSEKHSLGSNEIFYTKENAAETDFTVNVNVKLEIGADYYEKNLSNINKIQFTFIDSWGESTPEGYNSDKDKTTARKITVSSESPSVGKTHKAEDYEYITISTSSSLTIPTLNEGHTAIASEAANPVGFTYSGSKTGSKVFTKESLKIIQDKMREYCINSFNRIYHLNYTLKLKEEGRNVDINVANMNEYKKFKREQEKYKKQLKELNSKTDELQNKSNEINDIIDNLKPSLINKNNYSISNTDIDKIKNYIEQTNETASNLRNANDINIILNKYEDDLREHSNEVRNLQRKIKTRDEKIEDLEYKLDNANDTIDELEDKVSKLEEMLDYFKDLWKKFIEFLQNKFFSNNKYDEVINELYEEDILDDNDINIIENNIKDKDDFER